MKEKIAFIDEHTEAVIFDLGNVLLGYDWRPYLTSLGYDDSTNEILANAIFLNEDWERGDKGGITSQEWENLFIENAPAYESQILHRATCALSENAGPETLLPVQLFRAPVQED